MREARGVGNVADIGEVRHVGKVGEVRGVGKVGDAVYVET